MGDQPLLMITLTYCESKSIRETLVDRKKFNQRPMSSPKKTKNVTIKDVADLAGVSLMTVSRTIRKPESVSKKTRELVDLAIAKLNYIPDLSAGSLGRQSNTVAVILPSLSFEGHVRTINALSAELKGEGLHLLIGDNFYSPTEEMELLRMLLGHKPAGIVMVNSAHSDSGRELLLKSGVPVVETWNLPMRPLGGVVGFSHNNVGFEMTEHLIACGYKKIAFVSSPKDSDPRGKERHRGHLRAMEAHNLGSSRVIAIEKDWQGISAGKQAVDILLRDYPDADALVCLNDRIAMGAIMECKRRDLSVPTDLAITGHGGFDFAEHLVPALTTTRIDAAEIGRQTARLLIEKIKNDSASTDEQHIDVGFEIVPRESTLP